MSKSRSVKVVSSFGDIVTYEEHLERLNAYFEGIKTEATKLTQANPSLTAFIQGLKLVTGKELFIDQRTCKYFFALESRTSKVVIPNSPDKWESSTALDTNGCPLLFFQFYILKEWIRYKIVYEYFFSKFIKKKAYYQKFIKNTIDDIFRWIYVSSEKKGKCLELTYNYREVDFFWLVLNYNIKVLIGNFDDLKEMLSEFKDDFWDGGLMIVDMDFGSPKSEETYLELLKDFGQIKTWVWNSSTFAFWFNRLFRSLASEIDTVFKIGNRETFMLGELLTDTEDLQDELVRELKELQTGDNSPHEELVKRILTFCFEDEFVPFTLDEQVRTHNNKRIRDFIIHNTTAREMFWRDLKLKDEIKLPGGIRIKRGVKLILFDAKNHKNEISYRDIADTVHDYLVNHQAFGMFIIIVSRHGIKEDDPQRYDHLLSEGQVVLSLNDEDLIKMINLKRERKSPTSLIAEKYYDFLKKK